MLKLPLLIPPSLTGKQVNNERCKKTIMEKQFEYSDETIQTFQELVEEKEIYLFIYCGLVQVVKYIA